MDLAFTPQSGDASSTSTAEKPDIFLSGEVQTEKKTNFVTHEKDPTWTKEQETQTTKGEAAPTAVESAPRLKRRPTRPVVPHPSQIAQPLDPLTLQIEKIMEEGIGEAYQELTAIQKQHFKIKGEQTAQVIRLLLQKTKVKVKKVFQLILEWLKMLPGINRFFLMQEAKIKTDKILALKQHR